MRRMAIGNVPWPEDGHYDSFYIWVCEQRLSFKQNKLREDCRLSLLTVGKLSFPSRKGKNADEMVGMKIFASCSAMPANAIHMSFY